MHAEQILFSVKIRPGLVSGIRQLLQYFIKNEKLHDISSVCWNVMSISRYLIERLSLPAIALTTDTSILTSIGNDYEFNKIFSRQCESLVNEGDIIIAISTSGKSQNVILGIEEAKRKGAKIISLTGNNGGILNQISDICLEIPSNETPRIQEGHRILIHIICELVESHFKNVQSI